MTDVLIFNTWELFDMATVRDNLIALGFLPQLEFRNDSTTKVLYLKIKGGYDDRMNLTGPSKVPAFTLADQNKTLKPITGGVRFRLANQLFLEPPMAT